MATSGKHLAPLTELQVDAIYRNTNDWKKPDDQFNLFFRFADKKGINNTSGFRPKSRIDKGTDITDCAFCVLVTNFGESEWPDSLDRETGRFTYFGDNRAKGVPLHDTNVGGNRLLRHVYEKTHAGERAEVAPFLCFETIKAPTGTWMRFLGLACPGADEVSPLDDLVAVWRVKGSDRFQNYRSIFTILREESVAKAWLEDLVSGIPPMQSEHCPATWRQWVKQGRRTALKCARKIEPRSKKDQLVSTSLEQNILKKVFSELSAREFEFAADGRTVRQYSRDPSGSRPGTRRDSHISSWA